MVALYLIHARGDADLLIVTTAVETAKFEDTVLVGDDTDRLILLIFYADLNAKGVFFAPEPKANSKKNRTWNIKQLKETLGSSVWRHSLCPCASGLRHNVSHIWTRESRSTEENHED